MATLGNALVKLTGDWTIDSLPINFNDNLWNDVKQDCGLTNPEVSLLKTEVARIQTGSYT